MTPPQRSGSATTGMPFQKSPGLVYTPQTMWQNQGPRAGLEGGLVVGQRAELETIVQTWFGAVGPELVDPPKATDLMVKRSIAESVGAAAGESAEQSAVIAFHSIGKGRGQWL
jgi:hypothetical protein